MILHTVNLKASNDIFCSQTVIYYAVELLRNSQVGMFKNSWYTMITQLERKITQQSVKSILTDPYHALQYLLAEDEVGYPCLSS